MTSQSQTSSQFRALLRVQDLSSGQRSLVELMQGHQFGRIENMPVRAGQPIIGRELTVVRVARLGTDGPGPKSVASEEFDLKRPVRDLFDGLANLQNGTVIKLEFRHGLPFLLETTPCASREQNHLDQDC